MSQEINQDEVYLEFKYVKNHSMSFGDGRQYPIPMTMRAQPRNGQTVVMPFFDMDFVHKIELRNETPVLPDREDSFDDEHHKDLCRAAYDKARENREHNDNIRAKVYFHAKHGAIEVVNDPFKKRHVTIKDKAQKPTDIAKAIDEARTKSTAAAKAKGKQ